MSTGHAKLSVVTPVVTMLPQISGDWEKRATIEDLAQIAEAADRLGYHHLTCSEHIALPAVEHNMACFLRGDFDQMVNVVRR